VGGGGAWIQENLGVGLFQIGSVASCADDSEAAWNRGIYRQEALFLDTSIIMVFSWGVYKISLNFLICKVGLI
jgi:hypothetical protein